MAIVFGMAALTTALLTPIVRAVSIRFDLYVPIDPRKLHTTPMSQLGGIAIFLGFVVAIGLSFVLTNRLGWLPRDRFESLRLLLLLIGATMLWIVSLIDDLWDLPALPRLIWQFLCAFVAIGPYLWDHELRQPDNQALGIIFTAFNNPLSGGQINFHELSPWLAIGVTVLWIVGMTNTINWIDGLDGLAAGVTLIAATVLAIHTLTLNQYTIALLPLALAGACCGFLPYNFHPARIFMGDSGAMVLGYLLAITAIIGGAKLASALLVLGVPILDGIWMVFYRRYTGGRSMGADRRHLHHRLLDLGLSQRQVVLVYYSISLLFGAIALLVPAGYRLIKLGALGLLVLLLAGVLIYVTRRGPRHVSAGR
jgi:UDP-N-acetylmuramyl pentapeptide phosphotransferase/UDP-N-acetylglucosamine-1-phosphate transferase